MISFMGVFCISYQVLCTQSTPECIYFLSLLFDYDGIGEY